MEQIRKQPDFNPEQGKPSPTDASKGFLQKWGDRLVLMPPNLFSGIAVAIPAGIALGLTIRAVTSVAQGDYGRAIGEGVETGALGFLAGGIGWVTGWVKPQIRNR